MPRVSGLASLASRFWPRVSGLAETRGIASLLAHHVSGIETRGIASLLAHHVSGIETRGIASLLVHHVSGIDLLCRADWQINF